MSEIFIGLMSGTSLDAVDAVAVRFEPEIEMIGHHSHPLPEALRRHILQLTQPGNDSVDALGSLDIALGSLFGDATNALLHNTGLCAEDIRAIGSHGQTIRHRPELGFTLQIGDPTRIVEATGITTVADFRRRDLAAGGQGAPLVPAFHQALFHLDTEDRVIINVGGMANLTSLPGSPDREVIGFDTGPGNVLLNHWIQQQRGEPFDRDGQWAASGQIVPALLQQLLADPFFAQAPPKSTGRELFNNHWLQSHLNTHSDTYAAADVQATLLELTARSISDALTTLELTAPGLYLCGGGAHNARLRERLHQLQPHSHVETTAALGLDPDWVEAVAFAWLASRTLQGQSGNLPAVTGASGPRILGAIYPA